MTADVISLNDHTDLIDVHFQGVGRAEAVYLVKAAKTCLIDAGPAASAPHVIATLDRMGAFPPDMLILTHSHWDHSAGAPALCREAERRGRSIHVLASRKALEFLADLSWNKVLMPKMSFEPVTGVTPLDDGAEVDLGGGVLQVFDVAGHCADDLAVLDREAGTLFAGDSIGYHTSGLVLPHFMPPYWSPSGYRTALQKVKALPWDTLCLAHFGPISGDEGRRVPDRVAAMVDEWWQAFADAEAAGTLDHTTALRDRLLATVDLSLVDLPLHKTSLRLLLGGMNSARRLVGKPPLTPAVLQARAIFDWLQLGYTNCQEPRTTKTF